MTAILAYPPFNPVPGTPGDAIAIVCWHLRRLAEGAPYDAQTDAEVSPALDMLGY